MLSQQTIEIVKSTAPILQQHGETLTKHFYKRMFAHNPEVIPFFNHANQTEGTQQKALAAAITAYASHIDNLNSLKNAVELIAQKHSSLQIKAEHYPIVGENLLASIKEVLGEGATDAIINAWAEAYWFLANVLIGREKQIYEENSRKHGGWEGFRKFKVARKEKESSVITSFYLKPEDGKPIPLYRPGQYITVRIPTPDRSTTMRNYSLSDKPSPDYFRISVKREESKHINIPHGYVSNKLHNQLAVGDTLEIGAPCGDFFFDPQKVYEQPLVLLAAGVGITPVLSILLTALETSPQRPIVFIHACLNEEKQAFSETIERLAEKHSHLTRHYCYSEPATEGVKREGHTSTGFVTGELIESLLPSRDAEYYFCGPKPFMIDIYDTLTKWDIPESQIHFEFFGPKQDLTQGSASARPF